MGDLQSSSHEIAAEEGKQYRGIQSDGDKKTRCSFRSVSTFRLVHNQKRCAHSLAMELDHQKRQHDSSQGAVPGCSAARRQQVSK